MIEVSDLSVKLSGKPIINNISLKAYPGRISAIVGPNGSGKTTLMRALTGELTYTGKAQLCGRDIKSLSSGEQSKMRGVLPQIATMAFPFTVSEVVSLGQANLETAQNAEQKNQAISDALLRVGLQGFRRRLYTELSGGEKQRVQLARVLCQVGNATGKNGPKWLFLDEPVSSLDIRHQLQIMNVSREFAKAGGGVIAVLHDLNLTAMFADLVFMMNAGAIGDFGAPGEVFTSNNVTKIFDCSLKVNKIPDDNTPFVLPHSASH